MQILIACISVVMEARVALNSHLRIALSYSPHFNLIAASVSASLSVRRPVHRSLSPAATIIHSVAERGGGELPKLLCLLSITKVYTKQHSCFLAMIVCNCFVISTFIEITYDLSAT